MAWRAQVRKTPKSWAGGQSDTFLDCGPTEGVRGTRKGLRNSRKSKGEKRCKIQANSPQSLTGILQASGSTGDRRPAWPRPYLHPAADAESRPRQPQSPRQAAATGSPLFRLPPGSATYRGPAERLSPGSFLPAGRGTCALRSLTASLPPSEETSLSRGNQPAAGIPEKLFSAH